MIVQTHKALLPNCFLLAADVFFIVLMATGIHKHNPGPRAFKIMYREVRAFFFPHGAVCLKQVIFHLRACCGL